jgi:hypothetical protein
VSRCFEDDGSLPRPKDAVFSRISQGGGDLCSRALDDDLWALIDFKLFLEALGLISLPTAVMKNSGFAPITVTHTVRCDFKIAIFTMASSP